MDDVDALSNVTRAVRWRSELTNARRYAYWRQKQD